MIQWEDIYIQLLAYATNLLKSQFWFRQLGDGYLKGKEPHDYVVDTIEKYLANPEGYDCSTGRSLINYLKYHLMRTVVSNDVRSAENKTSSDLFRYADGKGDDDEPFLYIEAYLPFVQATFDQSIDCETIFDDVKEQIKGDEIAKLIFDGICCKLLMRRDIIEMHRMQDTVFDNGMKRLKRVLTNTAKKYQLG